ncbi:FliC/FljB family flagellin [Alloalcanivorax xenomutans]|uniref:FliC/FljB family flagellin n=1 Tax=Alloalcanivorax xenomutans TaxID=1094342 RepID=UPI0009B648F0|nr:FliC/FljB family flagellin [Alloalcanivorax xenomutans]ARB46725.1 flagellin [Alloalcanivorax xenomutans]
MSVINTNITAMIGQQNLGRSQSALQTSMERLSSGLRINSAKDDAAGQAIANRMSAQITGLSQAQRNANDGISIAQTAEGALNQINDNVQRIRELTVQAQNGTNSDDDLQSIQDEINQRTAEIDRISNETNFNGVKVLSGDQNITIQVGANDGESINVNLEKTNTATLKLDSLDVTKLPRAFSASGHDDGSGNTATDDATLVIEDSTNNALTGATVLEADNGSLYIKTETGEYYTATSTNSESVTGEGYDTVTVTADGATAMTEQEVSDAGLSPLADIDEALKTVDSFRSDLGAIQNRFESAITNLSTNETNLSAARSRIEDADYAVEVSNMTRAQILQQAGTSVLAQANQVPQSVLSLLG